MAFLVPRDPGTSITSAAVMVRAPAAHRESISALVTVTISPAMGS